MNRPHRIGFAGFRHPHIFGLLDRAQAHPRCVVAAACENDPATRVKLETDHPGLLTHFHLSDMLTDADVTIVAIGDVYARRGELALAALRAGKHIISDKPLCTSQKELDQIIALARENNLSVGCQFDLVEVGGVRQLKTVIQSGELGRLCTLTISAQHPLRLGSRANWYFLPGQHGGTINDIGIHIFDLVPWLTGQSWKGIPLAREWNAKAQAFPHFKDCAQFYAITNGGLTCFADVSYLAPDTLGYDLPQYWRITVHGTQGMAEARYGSSEIQIATDLDGVLREGVNSATQVSDYLQDFLDQVDGKPPAGGLTTDRVLTASRWALQAQACASASR